jgi:alkaline phosphatase D
VASGDPLPDAVIVWTRYTPVSPTAVISLELRMAAVDPTIPLNDHLDPAKNPNLRRAKVEVTSTTDWTAKIDVSGLKARTNYVFAFSDGTVVSEVGQTKTAPGPDEDVTQMNYAVFSCSNYGTGYFHAYDVASTIKDLDFWVHVGDYFVRVLCTVAYCLRRHEWPALTYLFLVVQYEYGAYRTSAIDIPDRKGWILPLWELITLQDYGVDEGLRNLRYVYGHFVAQQVILLRFTHVDTHLYYLCCSKQAPMIGVWDDHEMTNNAYGQGSVSNVSNRALVRLELGDRH